MEDNIDTHTEPKELSEVSTAEQPKKQPPKKNRRVAKFVRNVAITAFVLILLVTVAGIGYVWYIGKQEAVAVPEVTPVVTQKSALPKPAKPSPNNPVGVSVQAISSPVAKGENSSINIKTTPGAICGISVKYNEVPSTDSGLIKKTADDFGTVGWSWTVGAATPVGEWPVKIDCVYGTKSGMVQTDIEVTK